MTVEEALKILKEKGYKYTGKREEMIRIFAAEKRYMTAKEMLEKMQEYYPGISFDTIYRNLALFEQLEIVEATQLKDERIYRMTCSPHNHHHHLICTECGRTERINMCPMDAIFGTPDGFTITGHKFEIYGYCDQCKGGD
ncbi:ferric uptake regulator, Fur family [Caldalkalibacillus thermarum TA2.A1]|uniref:Ferric uptake regulator, Fur family n=1 Tax=Caldalkalibacillus thermarum (strain TA2.A1) TaxID=986075 RepID=F5L657_CALTT|nr:Fur family transcriptional regulator [Caldalkalibacillus thermarum]EGL83157.1 ferric uptake regulator, Fur family [Caldalkalibacillus thermarum TA2.A1]QZT35085.1 transcriptional repressor [Caldalkalibacillus thermarum TA2.A1]GGK12300.1 transcriptional repressor [Caldalkalibacillus thermarum]